MKPSKVFRFRQMPHCGTLGFGARFCEDSA
jgi:hypothetical protein